MPDLGIRGDTDASPNMVFEDLDAKVNGASFDFTDMTAVSATAARSLPPGFTLNIRAGKTSKYAVTSRMIWSTLR
jgi:hypothetical protein